mgnify:CR=1 FL=1
MTQEQIDELHALAKGERVRVIFDGINLGFGPLGVFNVCFDDPLATSIPLAIHPANLRAANCKVTPLRSCNSEDALEAENAALRGALREMLHAVCGETGFASAVRLVSGLAYPWPALDIAEGLARTALGENQ